MINEIKKIQTKDCIITILNNAPSGYEEMKNIAFRFNDVKFINLIKLPKLKYLDIVQVNNDLLIYLTYEPLRVFFNNFIDGVEKRINITDKGIEVADKINKSIKDLIKMAEKEMELSMFACMGLYGELLQLKELLVVKDDHTSVLSGWHRPAPANHDFDYDSRAIEVKTISKDKTTVKITSSFQLEAPINKILYLKIYRLEVIDRSTIDSLGDLYSEVKDIINTNKNKEEFAFKCVNDKLKYGGPKMITLPYKFILLEDNNYFVDQEIFPRINRNALPSSISEISYRIDLSSIEKFKQINKSEKGI